MSRTNSRNTKNRGDENNNLELFLKSNKLEFLCDALKELGVIEVSDLRWLSSDLVDTVEIITQMPLIQRRKFENLVANQKYIGTYNDEFMKTQQLQQMYCKKFETMKALVDSNKVTTAEFDEWRHEEFFKYFNNVRFKSIIFSYCLRNINITFITFFYYVYNIENGSS